MTRFVIDASVAIKLVVEEEGTPDALVLMAKADLIAPELLVAECANILWKKVQREHITREQALLAGHLLERAPIELMPTRSLMTAATEIAIDLDHPAYDCLYVALAQAKGCTFATADDRFLRKTEQALHRRFEGKAIALKAAAASLG